MAARCGCPGVYVAHVGRMTRWPRKVLELPHARPAVGARHFTSEAVEAAIQQVKSKIPDVPLATIFENCFPNTLDTTVFPGTYGGKPDTYVVTGDIDAMWLRDSSAQVMPYLGLAKQDPRLRELLEGVIRRQARMILIDAYANGFYARYYVAAVALGIEG